MDTLPGDGTAPVPATVPGPGAEEATMTDQLPALYVPGANPGANPSRIDPRDWYASAAYASLPPGAAPAPACSAPRTAAATGP